MLKTKSSKASNPISILSLLLKILILLPAIGKASGVPSSSTVIQFRVRVNDNYR